MKTNLKQILKIIYSHITGIYLTKKPLGSKEEYLEIFNTTKQKTHKEIDKYISSVFDINKKWLDNLALHTQVTIKKSSINYQHGRLLYSSLRKYLQGLLKESKINIVETGTARGFSSIIMAKALIDSGFNEFSINTIDIIPHNKKIYWNCIDDLEGKKTRKELLNPWIDYTKNILFHNGNSINILNKKLNHLQRINFAFLDGAHDYIDVKKEFSFIKKKQIKGDLIFFDDYSNSFPGIKRVVDEISLSGSYKIDLLKSSNQRGYAIAIKA